MGSYNNYKGLKSTVKKLKHKLFARNKLSAPTVPSQNSEPTKLQYSASTSVKKSAS